MPTKSGRIKLEDIRQGKTIWISSKFSNASSVPDVMANVFLPRPFMVVEGAKLRWAGIRWLSLAGIGEAYSYPAFALSPVYVDDFAGKADRRLLMHFFHPDRNKDIGTLPDGSFYHLHAFTTRRRCQRYCDQRNREQFFASLDSYKFTPRPKYDGVFVAPIEPWEKAPDVPGDV